MENYRHDHKNWGTFFRLDFLFSRYYYLTQSVVQFSFILHLVCACLCDVRHTLNTVNCNKSSALNKCGVFINLFCWKINMCTLHHWQQKLLPRTNAAYGVTGLNCRKPGRFSWNSRLLWSHFSIRDKICVRMLMPMLFLSLSSSEMMAREQKRRGKVSTQSEKWWCWVCVSAQRTSLKIKIL